MSTPKPSTKTPRPVKFTCQTCGQKRPPTLFMPSDPHHCTECLATEQANADFERLLALDEVTLPPKKRQPGLKVTSSPPEEPVTLQTVENDPQEGPKTPSGGDLFISPGPSTDPAHMELAARTLARRRLLPFIKRFKPKYDAGWVHEDICRRLERFVEQIEQGKEPRLLLAMPVRHGKSEIGSRHFAPWLLGKHPDWEIIAASGAQSLAMSFSRYIRDLVRDPAYQSVFPHLKLDASSQSVENWNTTYGGGYLAAGIGTMITGRGAHCVVPYCAVDTVSGRIPIAEISVGDLVYGYCHQTKRIVETEVKAVCVSVRKAKLVAIKNGPVLTADHKIYNPATLSYKDAGLSNGMPGLWRSEGSTRPHVLGVLLRDQGLDEHHAQMRLLRERLSARSSRAPEVSGQGWARGTGLLRARLLHAVQAGKSALVQHRERFLSAVRRACGWEQSSEILQPHVLHAVPHSPQGFAGVRRGILGAEDSGFVAGQDVRHVRPEEGAHGDASHRPRRGAQHASEFDSDVRALSPKVSYLHGASAASIAGLLQNEDFVVDIQTGTQNFFAVGVLLHNCLIIDDPVKDAEAADSAVIRDSTWEWYMSTAYTRLAPGGGVLGIMTFWNEDDWAGRIQQVMATGDGDKFEIVKYPAINDQGDEYILPDDTIEQIPPGAPVPPGSRMTRPMNTALHPARYTLDMLLRRKANYYALGQQRWWSALFQQNPAPEEGAFFTKDMFIEYVQAPRRDGRVVYQAWDFAITEKQRSDYTVAITVLVDEYDNIYVLDVWRFRTDDGIELGTAILEYARTWAVTQLAVEDGQIWKAIKANFEKACEGAKYYPSFEVIVPLTDKRTRAQPARGRMQQKKIQFPGRAPWYADFKNELLRFDAGGKHDDQVDALAHVVRLATTKHAPKGPAKQKPMKSWKDKLRTTLRGGHGSSMAA